MLPENIFIAMMIFFWYFAAAAEVLRAGTSASMM